MKINHENNITTFDYRTYKCSDPDIIRYNTSDRKIWYGSVKNVETSLKIQYIFDSGFSNKDPGILEFLLNPNKKFELDWKNPKEILVINRLINSEIESLKITSLIELITKLVMNSWTEGFEYGKKSTQEELKNILGLENAKS